MRTIAIVAGLAQMAIIFMVFFLKGLALGGWLLFALILLLVMAFVNLLILVFHCRLSPKDEKQTTKEKPAIVKRKDLRVTYTSAQYPTFSVGNRGFAVTDLSENGLRIRIDRKEPLKKRMRGYLVFLSSETLTVKVKLIRREDEEAALAFKEPLDYALLLREKQTLAGNPT